MNPENPIRPYGDKLDDGVVQLSFTLPLPASELARAAARSLCHAMNLGDVRVVHMQKLDDSHTFFIVYASSLATVDVRTLTVTDIDIPAMSAEEVNGAVLRELGHPAVVVGAATGTDAHTVGLDAILNRKGFHGDYGLERYQCFRVHNLGSQVSNRALVSYLKQVQADVLLVSQVVTQNELHLRNLTQLSDLLEAEGLRPRILTIIGGPRISHELAIELGFDAGFGAGTVPSQVAAFLATSLSQRRHCENS